MDVTKKTYILPQVLVFVLQGDTSLLAGSYSLPTETGNDLLWEEPIDSFDEDEEIA